MPETLPSLPLAGAIPTYPATTVGPSALIPRPQPMSLVPGAGLIACLDSLAAVAAILLVLISVNMGSQPAGAGSIEMFLSARITVKNVTPLDLSGNGVAVCLPLVRALRRATHSGGWLRGRPPAGRDERGIHPRIRVPAHERQRQPDDHGPPPFLASLDSFSA